MNGAIELPGEAAPLTPQQVYLALQSASSTVGQLIQTGTQQLQTWESQRGYYNILQQAFIDKSLPTEIRYLAIIQLKNGIDKYWRKTAANAIKPDEKAKIRSLLLQSGLGEADQKLALQNSLAVAKIVRIDYPVDWPDAITSVIATLRTAEDSDQIHLQRGLSILLRVVKELATARLRKSQTSLQSVTPELVLLLSHIYTQKVDQWTSFLRGQGDDEGGAMEAMENSLLALRILRKLLLVGYEYPNHNKEVQDIWAHSQEQFGQFFNLISSDPPVIVSPAIDIVEKHLAQLAKLHSEMADSHPAAFALLPNSLELTRAYWGLIGKYGDTFSQTGNSVEDGNDRKEKLCLRGLRLMRACIKMVFSSVHTFKYNSPEIKAEKSQAIELIKTQLLTDDLIRGMAATIVTKFFVFRQADLMQWEEEPDEWEVKHEGGETTWQFDVRGCSEKLFMDLVINFKHLLVQPLLEFFHSVEAASQSDVATKDSVYTAMGLAAPVLFQDFDFDNFLASTLVSDVQQTGVNYKVLRRRIAILIGEWVTVKISETKRSLVYQIFQHLLNPQDTTNDRVVRLTASRQFKIVVDDFGFAAEPFMPYAPDILNRLMNLIQEVDETEAKMPVLSTIISIIVRMEQNISPFADQLVALLPGLWEASGEDHLMKQSILTLLSSIVPALKEESQRYNSLILPLIQRAVEPGSDIQSFLMEETLELWSAILIQAPSPASSDLIHLSEAAFPLLEIASESLRVVLNIIDSYIVLAPEAMLRDDIRLRTLSHLTALLSNKQRELSGLVTTIVERLLRAAEKLGGTNGVTLVVKDLFESGYTEKIMEGLRDAWEAHQSVGVNKRYPKLDDTVETDYFTVLARVAIADPEIFSQLLASVGAADKTWAWISTEWFAHFDSMANIERQKLSCLALTRLLELPPSMRPWILGKLQDYFAMWTAVVREMQDGRDDGADNLIWDSNEGNEFEVPEDVRKRLLAGEDPVHTVHTFQFIKARLQEIIKKSGGEAEFQQIWLVNVDPDVLQGFQALSGGS